MLNLRVKHPRLFDAISAIAFGLFILAAIELSSNLAYKHIGVPAEATVTEKYSKNYLTMEKENNFRSNLYIRSFIHYKFSNSSGKIIEGKSMIHDANFWQNTDIGSRIQVKYLRWLNFSRIEKMDSLKN